MSISRHTLAKLDTDTAAALIVYYEGDIPSDVYTEAFQNLYEGGKKGLSFSKAAAGNAYSEYLSDGAAEAAYQAGQAAYEAGQDKTASSKVAYGAGSQVEAANGAASQAGTSDNVLAFGESGEATSDQSNPSVPVGQSLSVDEQSGYNEGEAAGAQQGKAEDAGGSGEISKGDSIGKFTYKHNPMDNPKAAKDIVENPDAVYGYSPNPNSERVGKFAEFDWTNEDVVSKAREARLQYHKDNESIYNLVKEMKQDGATFEEIAIAANQQRNLNRLQSYIDTGNISGYEKVVESNLRNFQNELGMTAEQAYAKYKSWYIVLEKAISANAGMDACCGLYDDFYYFYLVGGD